MAIKKLQNNHTTPEQSKLLLELGVPADSANLYTSLGFENLIWIRTTKNELSEDFFDALINGKSANIPIWSTGRLMEIIAECYQVDMPFRYFVRGGMIESLINTFIELREEIDFSKLEE